MVAAAGYSMLFLLGLLQGLVGAFQYSRSIGPVPVAAAAVRRGDRDHLRARRLGNGQAAAAGLCPQWAGSSRCSCWTW